MHIKTIAFSLAAAFLSMSASAHSFDHDRRWDGRDRGYARYERCDYSRPWIHERDHRHHARVGGAGPCHDIHRGDRLPRFYRSDRYHVGDWRYHDLPRPWQGHHWVRVGYDYVLVDRYTGRIAKVILLRHRR